MGPEASPKETLNSETYRDLRKRMLNGEDLTDTCKRCLVEEANQLASHRLNESVRLPHFTPEYVAERTNADGTLKKDPELSFLQVRLGNKCNLKCRMCGPSSSVAWYDEWVDTMFTGFKEEDQRIALNKNQHGVIKAEPNVYQWTEESDLLSYIEKCGSSLRHIQFSGGEPLMVRQHVEVLKYLVDAGLAPHMFLDYNSNLTILPNQILDLWSHFKGVDIGISIDGPPALNEYIRYPLKSSTFIENMKKLDRANIPGRLWVTTTVQIYNVLYLEELQNWLLDQKFERISPDISWHVLRAPQELSIFALPQAVKEEIANRMRHSVYFSEVAEAIFAEDKSSLFPNFLKSTRKMDDYRGQTIQQFSELWRMLSPHSAIS
jgi:MoaA/NifB/PqqE/SkfB family radical SAM enzyme